MVLSKLMITVTL